VDGLIGMSVGEERTVPVTFPDTWEPEQLRGVKANCTVKAKEIFDWSLPEVRAAAVPSAACVFRCGCLRNTPT